MRRVLARLRWFAATIWGLSWFELYLEIFRFRHVALRAFLGTLAPAQQFGPNEQPGGWLRTDLACALLSPLVWFVLRVASARRETGPSHSAVARTRPPLATTKAVALFGSGLAALGFLNQLIWRPPFLVDLTLRRGNGGFIVFGVACAVGAVVIPRVFRRGAAPRSAL